MEQQIVNTRRSAEKPSPVDSKTKAEPKPQVSKGCCISFGVLL